MMARILYVENNEIALQGVTAFLETHGHEVVGVEKISHAIEELSNDQFNLVICDGNLERPGDGADFAQQLARQFSREGRATKVMILSANTENKREGVRFCHKFGSGDLRDIVTELLAE
jgi:CheY-like chemotaxis protein